jgi:hypothetical protein
MKQKIFNNAKKSPDKKKRKVINLDKKLDIIKRFDAVIEEISDIGKDLCFEDVDSPNVRECLDSHSQPLTDTDRVKLGQQLTYDEKEEIASEGEGCVSKEILIKELE